MSHRENHRQRKQRKAVIVREDSKTGYRGVFTYLDEFKASVGYGRKSYMVGKSSDPAELAWARDVLAKAIQGERYLQNYISPSRLPGLKARAWWLEKLTRRYPFLSLLDPHPPASETSKSWCRRTSPGFKYRFRDQLLTLTQISDLTGVPRPRLKGRLSLGWDIDKAATEPVRHRISRSHRYSLSKISRETGVPLSTLKYRLRKGWTLENASIPPKKAR